MGRGRWRFLSPRSGSPRRPSRAGSVCPPAAAAHLPMSDADAEALRGTARRTWRFFETFVTSTDNMLPPDNFQDDPAPAIAHRTSPTDLGLYLLSVVNARDFGWIGADQAIERLEATLATMSRLQRFRGHFYNWYDTRDLSPLDPRYVSTVDSGNLAGHLIALANACREWRDRPFAARRRLDGVADALDITCAESARLRDGGQTQTVTLRQLDDALAVVALAVRQAPLSDDDLAAQLVGLSADAEIMIDIAGALAIERGDGSGADMLFWAAGNSECDRRAPPRSRAVRGCGSLRGGAALNPRKHSAVDGACDGFRLLVRQQPPAAVDRISRAGRRARFELLRSPGFRGAARQLFCDRQRRRRGQALVPARPRRDARRARRRVDFVVGIDVRVSDALARHARAGGKLARADQPSDRAPPDRLRRETRPALGHIRIRLQRPRPGSSLTSIRTSAFPASG